MRATLCIALLLALGACSPPGNRIASVPSISAPPEVNDQQRVLRVAYALKFLQYTNSEETYRSELRSAIEKTWDDVAKRYAPGRSEEHSTVLRKTLLAEVDKRFPEILGLIGGVFADVYTTDELRRISDFVSLVSVIKLKNKQPLTEEDSRELLAANPAETLSVLERKKAAVNDLAKVRGEIWGRCLAEEVHRRNPSLFQEKAI